MKTAILTVGYGVRDVDEMRRSVFPVERAVADAFPECAFFSGLACEETASFLRQSGENVRGFEEALAAVRNGGFENAFVVPLLLARGQVYHSILKFAEPFPVSGPLLDDDGDLMRIAAVYGEIAGRTGRIVLLMGHGNTFGDGAYERLAKILPENVHMACRSGQMLLEDILPALEKGPKRLLLMPLMLTSGRHARGEMAGESPASWKSRLTRLGFDVETDLRGMGSMPEIQCIFIEKAAAMMRQ